MVGIVHSEFKEGDLCYIVLEHPGKEFLPGKFVGILPEHDPAWKDFAEKGMPEYAKPAQAIVLADPAGTSRHPADPIYVGHPPYRQYYGIISPQDYISYLETVVKNHKNETASSRK